MMVVVDASVAVKWYVEEEFSANAALLLEASHRLHAPELIYPEFGSIMWKKVRRGEAAAKEGRNIIDRFRRLTIKSHPHEKLLKASFVGAQLTGQTVYDWTYLSLAIALKCKFVTADRRFFTALKDTSLVKNLMWIEEARSG